MRTICHFLAAAVLLFKVPPCFSQPTHNREVMEINSLLMASTFIIGGKGADGSPVTGTAFVLGLVDTPTTPINEQVLVTAAHVFERISEDTAQMAIRDQDRDGRWTRRMISLRIREKGKPRWVRHPSADVAVLRMEESTGFWQKKVMNANMALAKDQELEDLGLHPGDEVRCLGFPLGNESNDAGFPLLRRGVIASYPILPTKETKRIVIDANIFPGNSGGPVYYEYLDRAIAVRDELRPLPGLRRQILGLISQNQNVTETRTGIYGPRAESFPLGLANVIPSSFIRETIELLK